MHKVKPASPLVSCDLETQPKSSGGCGIIQDYDHTLMYWRAAFLAQIFTMYEDKIHGLSCETALNMA